MLVKLAGGRVYDPINGVDGEVRDLWIEDGRIVAAPTNARPADEAVDGAGRVVMPGGIDLHSHIGGGKLNIARMMPPEEHRPYPHPPAAGRPRGRGAYNPATVSTR